MVISASRRTDIPAFYTDWFMNRVRAGYCTYPNPFNPKQVVRVSLRPEDVDVIVFWSKNPTPLLEHLQELDGCGLHYYFQFTITGYPSRIEPRVPKLEQSIATFRRLSERVSPELVIWRYDPILWADAFGAEYHIERFTQIAKALQGSTRRVVISLVDDYRDAGKRMRAIEGIQPCIPQDLGVAALLGRLSDVAGKVNMEIVSCAEPYDLRPFGIRPGGCVDNNLINQLLGTDVPRRKDPSQRKACGCVLSRDIGMYGSCRHGCLYCYAAGLPSRRREFHNTESPSLLGWYEADAEAAQPCPLPSKRSASQAEPVQQQLALQQLPLPGGGVKSGQQGSPGERQ